MKIILIGAGGQLGSDLMKVLAEEELIPLRHLDADITDFERLKELVCRHKPDVVIDTAAYHKVDECERNPQKTFEVNALGTRNVALACKETGSRMVFISTDYVFNGRKGAPYVETDIPDPINVYGISKLAGECFVRNLLDEYFIVRTSGLFGVAGSSGKGGNFIETMLRLAGANKEIKVVGDQIMSPTYTLELAKKICELIKTEEFGLYHITNNGECSWYDFAGKIFELSGVETNLKRTTTKEFGAPASRPPYSVLGNGNLQRLGLDDMKAWDEALKAYLQERKRRHVTKIQK
ncbi:MAG: dTDP-4-dehydrorhamnose reductase [Candidatus Omnitrophota bacterium]